MRAIIFSQMLLEYHKHRLAETDVDREIISVMLTVVLIFFIGSGLFNGIENANLIQIKLAEDMDREWHEYKGQDIDLIAIAIGPDQHFFHESLYFVIITLTTVGYGDINPESPSGKVLVISIMLLALIVIPH
jgi:voltage-gated potassium channel Kch